MTGDSTQLPGATAGSLVAAEPAPVTATPAREGAGAHEERLPYEPALDGLRGVAVAGVLLFHGGYLTGGYLGVDAFFVLSGFLVTSLLLVELGASGRIALGSFWLRRARRLLPALGLVLLAVSGYAAWIATPFELDTIRADGLATILYVANWRRAFGGVDYFDLFRSPSPLQHTWSLAIEEQFYLLWPLVVAVVTGGLLLGRRRAAVASGAASAPTAAAASLRLRWLCIGGALASFAWMQVLAGRVSAARLYYGTDTRVASLLIGAALASFPAVRSRRFALGRPQRRALEAAAWASVAFLTVCWIGLAGDSRWLVRGGLFACAIAVAVVIAAVWHPERGPLQRVLAVPPLRALGIISYGVYLWHWPIYVLLSDSRTGLDGLPLLALRIAVTIVVATLSYRLIEHPIRSGSWRSVPVIVAPVTAVAVVAALLWSTAGAFDPEANNRAFFADAVPDRRSEEWQDELARLRAASTVTGTGPRVLLVGDSVVQSLSASTPSPVSGQLSSAAFGLIGCGLTPGKFVAGGLSYPQNPRCRSWPALVTDVVAAFRPTHVVLMLGPWEMVGRETLGGVAEPGTPPRRAALLDRLGRLEQVAEAGGAQLVVLDTACFDVEGLDEGFSKVWAEPWTDTRLLAFLNGTLDEFVASRAGRVGKLGFASAFCPGGVPVRAIEGVTLRSDGVHFTPEGGRFVWDWVLEQLPAASATPSTNPATSTPSVPSVPASPAAPAGTPPPAAAAG